MCEAYMSLMWDFCRGCMLNRFATKAKLSLLFPDVTSWGETNCLQSNRAACCSISSALWFKSGSWFKSGKSLRLINATKSEKIKTRNHNASLTHTEAADINFDFHFEVVLFLESDLVQQVEVGSRVLQWHSTRTGSHPCVCVIVCVCVWTYVFWRGP